MVSLVLSLNVRILSANIQIGPALTLLQNSVLHFASEQCAPLRGRAFSSTGFCLSAKST
jgi:hypothetical protein